MYIYITTTHRATDYKRGERHTHTQKSIAEAKREKRRSFSAQLPLSRGLFHQQLRFPRPWRGTCALASFVSLSLVSRKLWCAQQGLTRHWWCSIRGRDDDQSQKVDFPKRLFMCRAHIVYWRFNCDKSCCCFFLCFHINYLNCLKLYTIIAATVADRLCAMHKVEAMTEQFDLYSPTRINNSTKGKFHLNTFCNFSWTSHQSTPAHTCDARNVQIDRVPGVLYYTFTYMLIIYVVACVLFQAPDDSWASRSIAAAGAV